MTKLGAMERIELGEGAYLEFDPHWLSPREARETELSLLREVPWEARAIRIFGREVMQPRQVAWIGDPEAIYTYSKVTHAPLPWTPTLSALRADLLSRSGRAFNAVLCNLYRDGRDSMGMHSDAEPELGPEPIVASLSLGAPRKFQLRHRRGPARGKLDLVLGPGSLLWMLGSTQRHYRHGVPKQPALTAPRINLTFRQVFPR